MSRNTANRATLDKAQNNTFHVVGELSFYSVPQLLQQGDELFTNDQDICLDLNGVTRSDSAGVALLIEWTREAAARNRTLNFKNMPPQMQAIAKVSGVDKILAIEADPGLK